MLISITYVIRNITISLMLLRIGNNLIALQSDKMLSRQKQNDTSIRVQSVYYDGFYFDRKGRS